MSSTTPPSEPGWMALTGLGAALLVLATVIWFDAFRLPASQTVGVGPTAAMRLVSVLVAILGVAHWIAAWRSKARSVTGQKIHSNVPTNHSALAWVLGGLLGLIAMLQMGVGFIIGATWLFAATARAFGQPLRLKSPLIGLALATAVYAFFTLALSLSLPAGPLERLLLS